MVKKLSRARRNSKSETINTKSRTRVSSTQMRLFSACTLEQSGRQKPTLKTASDMPKSESLAGPR